MPIPKITELPATPTTVAEVTGKVAGLIVMTKISQGVGVLDDGAPADLMLKELGLQDPEAARRELPPEGGDAFMLGALLGIVLVEQVYADARKREAEAEAEAEAK